MKFVWFFIWLIAVVFCAVIVFFKNIGVFFHNLFSKVHKRYWTSDRYFFRHLDESERFYHE